MLKVAYIGLQSAESIKRTITNLSSCEQVKTGVSIIYKNFELNYFTENNKQKKKDFLRSNRLF